MVSRLSSSPLALCVCADALHSHHARFALERESKSFALALMAAQHWREWAMYVHMGELGEFRWGLPRAGRTNPGAGWHPQGQSEAKAGGGTDTPIFRNRNEAQAAGDR